MNKELILFRFAAIICGFTGYGIFLDIKNAITIGHTWWSTSHSFWFTLFICTFVSSLVYIIYTIKDIFNNNDDDINF